VGLGSDELGRRSGKQYVVRTAELIKGRPVLRDASAFFG
jgi:hypothetical protein